MNSPFAPSPRGLPLLGNYFEFRSNAFQTMQDWQHQYGDLVHFCLGPRHFHLISHPELAEDILISRQDQFVKIYSAKKPRGVALILGQGLVTSSDALWRHQRRLIQPLFAKTRVADYADEIVAAGRGLLSRWKHEIVPCGSVDISSEMMRTTLEIITRTMFNISVLDKFDLLSSSLLTVLHFAAYDMRNPLRIPFWMPTPRNVAFRKAMGFLDNLVYQLIHERKKAETRRDDLLDKLVDTRDEGTGLPMSDRQVRDEVLTILTAGHETTAITLTWALYLLATHPMVQDRLHAELDTVLGKREPTMEDLPQLAWTRAVVEETLRLYPPAAILMRKNADENTLGGYRLPKNALLVINVANIHRHKAFWEHPDAFKPERFLPNHSRPSHRLAYMPFGAGPRVCVGSALALSESILLLAMIAQAYRLDISPGQVIVPEIEVTLRPKGGMRLTLSPR